MGFVNLCEGFGEVFDVVGSTEILAADVVQVLPAEAKPVREWSPQSKGWKSVSDGLMMLFGRLREERG